MRVIGLLILLALVVPPAGATRGEENYPKVLSYTMGVSLMSEAMKDTLSWYDVLVCMERPETIQELRQRNPDQRYLWHLLPQYVEPMAEENPWWMPDTLWSIKRLMMVYAHQNDWFLKDTSGEPITGFGGAHRLLNWTEYCPVGTFGTAKGLRAAEWVASVALPTIALSGRSLDPWDWDSQTSYNGLMFEILADCLGSYGWGDYQYADPDQDGQAEGVYSTCSTGGADDPLTLLFRAENVIFYQRLREQFPSEFVFLINENNSYIGPDWVTELSGMKLENWMRDWNPSWHDWWDWFYGLTPPWLAGENWGAGYAWAESEFDANLPDARKGWDLSFIETWKRSYVSEAENLRQMRWGLGTSLLGDGYFAYTYDQKYPLWQPEYELDFGTPLDDFTREMIGSDTLYVRLFSEGMVEVNPYERDLNGIPAEDSRFTLWLPVDDLAVEVIGDHSVRAEWTAPVGDYNQADSYELRFSTVPLSIENWEQASQYAGNPVIANPGASIAVTVDGLSQGQTYFFAVRTETRGRLEPSLSNQENATLGVPVDNVPPGTIVGLDLIDAGESWLDLAWTATGDDGDWGTASFYFLRTLVGEPIEDEDDWARGVQADSLPIPGPPGSAEEYRLEGLLAGQSYGIAVRARDDAGNLSPLHAPFTAETVEPPPPPHDDVLPASIDDLAGEPLDPGEMRLSWSAPGDDGWVGVATSYELRLLLGAMIDSEQDWANAQPAGVDLPQPAEPHTVQTIDVTSLVAGASYGVAVRARDEADNLGGLSNPLLVLAGAEPPPDEDSIPPAAIDDLQAPTVDDTFFVLTWTAPGDDDHDGSALLYHLRLLLDEAIDDEESWTRGSQPQTVLLPKPAPAGTPQAVVVGGLLPGRLYGVALRAEDEADNLAPLSSPLLVETSPTADVDETPPDPIQDLAEARSDTTSLLLRWTAPTDDEEPLRVDRYQMRMAFDGTADEAVWDSGLDLEGLPAPGEPGTIDSFLVPGLDPETRYGFAIRSFDTTGNLSAVSNILWAETEPLPFPPAPPAAVEDLQLLEVGPDSAAVAWTAPGDDGSLGRAVVYHVRIRTDGPIDTEEDWLLSDLPDTTGLGRPAEGGTPQSWVVRGLVPATTYSLAIRAEDDSSQLGALSSPFSWTTEEQPPPDPPAAIVDLAAGAIGPDSCALSWTRPPSEPGRTEPVGYRLALRAGSQTIETEADWAAFEQSLDDLPEPGLPGEKRTYTLLHLEPDQTYSIALRTEGSLGRLGELGPGIVVTTAAAGDSIEEPEEPEEPDDPPAAIDDLSAFSVALDGVELHWTAVGENGREGHSAEYRMRLLEGEPFETEDDWERGAPVDASLPIPGEAGTIEVVHLLSLSAGTRYGLAVRALDQAGQISPWAGGIEVEIPTLPPPPPSPVSGPALVEIGPDHVSVEWSHAEDPESEVGPLRFHVGLLDEPILPSNWDRTARHPAPPTPAPAGTTVELVWDGLAEGTDYWVAVQVESRSGQFSSLSSVLAFTTSVVDLSPPDPPGRLWIERHEPNGAVRLGWDPSPSPDVEGYQVYGRTPDQSWDPLFNAPLPVATTQVVIETACPAFAVTAIDAAGNEGSLSPVAEAFAETVSLRGPFPHPVPASCRFEIEMPASVASEPLRLEVRDAAGRRAATLYEGTPGPLGYLEVRWDRTGGDGVRLAPGFYLLKLEGRGIEIHRTIFLSP